MSVTNTNTTTSTKTFLPQKTLLPLWKDGFETWHIAIFVVKLTCGNIFLLQSGMIDRPNPGKLPLDDVLNPLTNPVFRIFLLTSVALFVKTHAVAWAQAWLGCKNNSFSRNSWDKSTGSSKVEARTTEQDVAKSTMHNIQGNDIENIPLTLILHLLLVLCQPTESTAKLIMITYTISRFLHTFWYAYYGSHEIRAILWSVNCWANYAVVCQILAACEIL
jgi:uncharacterized membrane protein YecN with MAPEG domain